MLNPSSILLATCAQQVINGITGARFVCLNQSTRFKRGSDAVDDGLTLIPCQEASPREDADVNLPWLRGHESGVCRSGSRSAACYQMCCGAAGGASSCLDLIGKCFGNLFLFPPRTPEFGISLQCFYEVVVLQRCLETVTETHCYCRHIVFPSRDERVCLYPG